MDQLPKNGFKSLLIYKKGGLRIDNGKYLFGGLPLSKKRRRTE